MNGGEIGEICPFFIDLNFTACKLVIQGKISIYFVTMFVLGGGGGVDKDSTRDLILPRY